jgi:hypothetical protein
MKLKNLQFTFATTGNCSGKPKVDLSAYQPTPTALANAMKNLLNAGLREEAPITTLPLDDMTALELLATVAVIAAETRMGHLLDDDQRLEAEAFFGEFSVGGKRFGATA